jgi:hypothetical protein
MVGSCSSPVVFSGALLAAPPASDWFICTIRLALFSCGSVSVVVFFFFFFSFGRRSKASTDLGLGVAMSGAGT